MKIQKKKLTSKKLTILVALALIILIAGGVSGYSLLNRDAAPERSSGIVDEPSKSDRTQAKELASNPGNKEKPVNTDPSAPLTPSEEEGEMMVTMVSSVDVSDEKVFIRGGLNGVVVDEGQCFALLNGPGGETLRKDTTLLQNVSTTDCKTIVIESFELTPGDWKVTLNYSSKKLKGSSNENSFKI